jgi:peptidoglycan/LPS O-acetylase OafA/YrhL
MKSQRIHGLDTLRALAIMLVFANHYMGFVTNKPTFGIVSELGWMGVDLFFALSGYLIGNQIFAGLREGGFSLKNFYARRLLRTLPNYYVVLALYAFWPLFAGTAPHAPWWKYWTFTLNFELIPGTRFSHAWSLCVEEQFYLLLPAVVLLIAAVRAPLRLGWCAIAASLVAGMILRALAWQDVQPPADGNARAYTEIYYATWARFDELIVGVMLALIKNHHAAAWTRLTSAGNAMFAGGLAVTALACWYFLDGHFGFGQTVFGYPLLGLGFGMLLLAGLSPGSLLARIRIPGAASIALWSYAIYLTHKQLCIILARQLERHYQLDPGGPLVVSLLIAASVLAGFLLYILVETPFMRLRERFVPTNSARRKYEEVDGRSSGSDGDVAAGAGAAGRTVREDGGDQPEAGPERRIREGV